MTDTPPRQAYDWHSWHEDVNRLLGKVQRDLEALRKDHKADIATFNKNFQIIAKNVFGLGKENDGEPSQLTQLIVEVAQHVTHILLREQKAMRDCGVWSADRTYDAGAAVTFDGCLWTCQVENKATKPGDGAMWRLMHKTADVQMLKQIRAVVRDEVRRQMQEKGR